MVGKRNLNNTFYYKNKFKLEKLKKVFSKKVAIACLGFSVMFFSVIGFGVTVKNLSLKVARVVNDSAEKEKFERYILPVVMFDPVPFVDIKTVDEFSLLRSAIWAAFMNNGKEKYLNEKYNSFIVPVSDVEVSLHMLYGEKIKIEHQTFSDGFTNNYIYNKETDTYTVSIYDKVGSYSPKIKKITKNKDTYILTVGYIRPDDVWQMYFEETKKQQRFEKYMNYVLKRTGDNYSIVAIKDTAWDNK